MSHRDRYSDNFGPDEPLADVLRRRQASDRPLLSAPAPSDPADRSDVRWGVQVTNDLSRGAFAPATGGLATKAGIVVGRAGRVHVGVPTAR